MLLAAIALALSLIFGGSAPSPTPSSTPAPAAANYSKLPPTQPGLSHDEGVFFVTTADDGSRAVYFIAGNTRHSILWTDMQIELQLNPLWPVYTATPDQVVAYPEGAPVGAARTGLLGGGSAAPAPAPAPAVDQPAALAPQAAPPVDQPPAPAAEAAPAPSDDSQPATVTLKPGDNLTHIAAQYGTSIDAILAANGLPNANRIYAGQSLIIPNADSAVADQPPAPVADTPAPTANAPTPVADTATAPADTATADPSADASTPTDSSTYTVQPGDTAYRIARTLGVDQGALLQANGISNPNRVYVGQVLTIPGSSS